MECGIEISTVRVHLDEYLAMLAQNVSMSRVHYRHKSRAIFNLSSDAELKIICDLKRFEESLVLFLLIHTEMRYEGTTVHDFMIMTPVSEAGGAVGIIQPETPTHGGRQARAFHTRSGHRLACYFFRPTSNSIDQSFRDPFSQMWS